MLNKICSFWYNLWLHTIIPITHCFPNWLPVGTVFSGVKWSSRFLVNDKTLTDAHLGPTRTPDTTSQSSPKETTTKSFSSLGSFGLRSWAAWVPVETELEHHLRGIRPSTIWFVELFVHLSSLWKAIKSIRGSLVVVFPSCCQIAMVLLECFYVLLDCQRPTWRTGYLQVTTSALQTLALQQQWWHQFRKDCLLVPSGNRRFNSFAIRCCSLSFAWTSPVLLISNISSLAVD